MSPSRPHAPRPSGGSSSRPSGRNSRPSSGQVPASGGSSRGSVAGSSRPTPGVSPGSAVRPQRAQGARNSSQSESSTNRGARPQRTTPSAQERGASTNPRSGDAALKSPATTQRDAGTRGSSGSTKKRPAENVAAYEVGAPLNRNFGLFHNASVRLLALTAMVIVAVVIITPVARNYMKQYNANADIQQQIAEQQTKNEALRNDVSRWEDDSYVIAQARERLTFVFPGETPYRVMGWDPEDLSDGDSLPVQKNSDAVPRNKVPWYEDVFGSIAKSGELSRQSSGLPQKTDVDAEPLESPDTNVDSDKPITPATTD